MAKTYSLKVEIFAVGRWNGMPFERDDLMSMASAFTSLKELHKVPLKFGHNDEQPMTDGYPALGWVQDVFVEGDKLFAEFSDMPEIVFNAMQAKLYRNVSIELDFGVEHKGNYYPFVLSGVALLGADIPAVNTIADLQTYMSRNNELKFTKRMTFTAIEGDDDMAEIDDLKARLATLEAENKAKNEAIDKVTQEKIQFERKATELETKETQRQKDEATAAFNASKQSLVGDLDNLVKANKITPAQRDKFTAEMTDDNGMDRVKFAVEAFGEIKGDSGMNTGEHGQHDNDGAGDDITTLIKKAQLDHKCDFSTAKQMVFRAHPDKAREWLNANGQKGA